MIDEILTAARQVVHSRVFENERGYKGALAEHLMGLLGGGVYPGDLIVEEEYQKRVRAHGLRIRPDIIIHRPAAAGENRRLDNHAVVLLKRAATRRRAERDFFDLNAIINALDYAMGIFVNIDSDQTHSGSYAGPFRGRLHFIAVARAREQLVITHDHLQDGEMRSAEIRVPVKILLGMA
jgi:hypothetical protein